MRSRLVAGTAWLTLGMVASQASSMLVYALTARIDSPAQYGRLTATVAWVTVLSGVAVWGSNLVAARNVATQRFAIGQFRDWLRSRMIVFGAGALLVLPVCTFTLGSPIAGVGLALFFLLINGTSAVGAWFLAQEDYRTLFTATAVSRAALMAFTVGSFIGGWLSATVLPALLGGALLLETLWLFAQLPTDSARRRFVNPWSGTLTVGAAASATGLQQLDTPMLAAVAGPAQAGLYSAVLRWTNPLTLIPTAFAGASLSQIAAAKTRQKLVEVYLTGLRLLPVQLVGLAVLWAFAGQLVQFALGPAYADSAMVLRLLLLGTLPRMLCDPLFVTLQSRGDERWALGSVMLYTTTLMIGVAFAGQAAGAIGAAFAWSVAQLVFLVALATSVFLRMSARADETGGAT